MNRVHYLNDGTRLRPRPRIRGSALAILIPASMVLTGCTRATGHSDSSLASTNSAARQPVPGGRILFRQYLDSADTQGALFVMDSDGSHPVQLTKPTAGEVDEDPDWSPDGSRIVFTRHADPGGPAESQQLVIMAADGSAQHPLTPGTPLSGTTVAGLDSSGAFSPDGTEIAFVHSDGVILNGAFEHSNVEVMNVDGSNIRPVTTLAPYGGSCTGTRWSPDGKQLVYSFRDATIADPSLDRALFVVSADGSGKRQVTKWSLAADGNPAWSATNLIAFRSAPNDESGVGNFFTIHPDSSHLVQVSHYKDTEVGHKVSFSPDGSWIVYGSSVDGVIQLTISAIDGSQNKVLTTATMASSAPDWSPTN